MNRPRAWLLSAAVILASITAALAQEPGQGPGPGRGGQGPFPGGRFGGPARDNPEPVSGTARITGRIISAETGAPIRRAQIRISSPEVRINRNTTTDADGRFEIASLPAGRYRLYVGKAGYVSLEYGQARPFEAGRPLEIIDGQTLDRIDLHLPRGSVISGRISDEFGDPITDVQVQAMRYQFINGERQLVNAGRQSTTDDIGQFRIFGLMPGDYVVLATLRANNGAATMPPNSPEGPTGYPGTYYPGVTDVGQAQTMSVTLGQELSSVAFSLVPARLSRISGTVTSSEGRPLAGAVVVMRPAGGGMGLRLNAAGGGQVREDGTFRLVNVPPGEYVLNVQERPRNLQSGQSPPDLQNLDIAGLEFASVPLSVSGDIDNLVVITTSGVSVSGKVVFQGQGGQQASPRGVQVSATASSGTPSMMEFASRALGGGRVNDNGTFQLVGLAGSQVIRAGGLPSGWAVKQISLDGMDMTDAPFDFRPGSTFGGLVVTLTDRITEVAGGVRDARGQAVADYVIVVFAEDATLWAAQSRYVATARPDQNGAFRISGLPPSRYLAAALPSLESGMQNDIALLTQLRGRAENFALTEGQSMSLSLNMPTQ